MRPIDADALTEDCKRYLGTLNPDRDGKECTRIHWLIGVLANASTIEPERKTGKWITDKYGNVLCSECNWCAPKIMAGNISNRHLDYAKPNFCWHCGARMVKEGEDNDE